jgi:hypothetical protein
MTYEPMNLGNTDDISQRPITYIVKISCTKTETALIPVVAMTAEEATAKAWARRGENNHEWKLTDVDQKMHGIVDTRGFATKFKAQQYNKGES